MFMKKLLKKNLLVLLISLMLTGTFGTAFSVETVYARDVLDRSLETLVYNGDNKGNIDPDHAAIYDAIVDNQGQFTRTSSNSHIWYGDISKYKTENDAGNSGDAYWRVVDEDHDYNGTSGRMFLTSEFTWAGAYQDTINRTLGIIYNKTFSDAEKAAMSTDNYIVPADATDFRYFNKTWEAATEKTDLSNSNRLFSLSAREVQTYFSKRQAAHKGSNSKTNSASNDYARQRINYTPDRDTAGNYWLRQKGYFYGDPRLDGSVKKLEGQ